MSTRNCNQCIAITKTGEQCSKKTCKSVYCWIHLKQHQSLRIKKSIIPSAGDGLFTLKESKEEASGVYVLKVPGVYINAYKTDEPGLGRWINQCRTADQRARLCNNNSRFSWDNRNKIANIKATRIIHPGDEVFLNYGPAYWNQM